MTMLKPFVVVKFVPAESDPQYLSIIESLLPGAKVNVYGLHRAYVHSTPDAAGDLTALVCGLIESGVSVWNATSIGPGGIDYVCPRAAV
jgi:hypothetical protein